MGTAEREKKIEEGHPVRQSWSKARIVISLTETAQAFADNLDEIL